MTRHCTMCAVCFGNVIELNTSSDFLLLNVLHSASASSRCLAAFRPALLFSATLLVSVACLNSASQRLQVGDPLCALVAILDARLCLLADRLVLHGLIS